jgi:hypothetical protein
MSQTALDELDELTEAGAADGDPAGSAALVGMLEVTPDEPAVEAPGGVIFVTPYGTWVREGSSEFFGVLGDTQDYDAPLYAIKNFGFIAVCILPKSLVDIKLHPRNVTAAALFSIQNVLSSIRSNSFRITYLKDTWTSEVASSATRAICRLSEICALEGVGITLHESTALVH